ncbi:MAG: SanA protein [Flammeovirgaceae bacterium]|nr:SanA protein [Flammeovirgaceae bacterium]MBR08249.1 SanA protein [Rickettsiales bacterium]HCX21353.1 SanA protein [Cytophagales bacterium]|tara:strand:+ start:16 stop:645 length:630 start_codon:yes stop_codon:yes gene_type:complete
MLRLLKITGILIILVGVLILGLNFWIVSSTQDKIYYNINDVPPKRVALLLGTSKRTVQGGTNKYFAERMQAAADLYHRGIIEHIIVSGDNQTVYYNEPRDMLNALKELGVPEGAITLDYAGFRTLDSVVRSKEVFGQDEVMIITQDFHCYRALFIADYHGINAVAFSADNKDQLPWSLAVRETLARAKAVFDLYLFDQEPKFLGEPEKL